MVLSSVSLQIPTHPILRHSFILWFILAVVALAFSGIYSFLPFALRTPFLADLLQLKDFFKTSLIVHVNLAVLVWFLSCSAMFMIMVTKEIFASISFTAFITSMIGTIFIILSPFVGAAIPVINNYIPILHNLTFILGISLFLTGILLQSILTALSFKQVKSNLINLTIYISALIFLVAVLCFIQSAMQLNKLTEARFIDLIEYYELLFWGAGHVLQFNYIQLVIIVWLVVMAKLCPKFQVSGKSFSALQWGNFMLVIATSAIYLFYSLDSIQLYDFFTLHMKYVGGALASVVAAVTAYALYKQNLNKLFRIEFIAFAVSAFLIFTGGFIGYLIIGANVTIPAHYHGVIIGITVGLMGMFYLLLHELGFKKVQDKKACWQMMLYGGGQFIHVIALAVSGGYGVLRKSPGESLSTKATIFMSMMGVGGIIALVGGIMFVVFIFQNMKKEVKNNA